MTIKFIGNEIGDAGLFYGFETSFEFATAVARGYCEIDTRDYGGILEMRKFGSGDLVFDYETGTMWEVVE